MAFFQPWLRALDQAAALRLRLHLEDVHARDLHLEELLDRLADLGLVGVLVHAERVLAVGGAGVALLGDDRREDDLARRASARPSPRRAASAASLTTSERAQTTAPTSSSDGATTATRWRLRNDFAAVSLLVGQHDDDRRRRARRPRARAAPAWSRAPRTSPRRRARASRAWAWLASADRSAALAALRFTFWTKRARHLGEDVPAARELRRRGSCRRGRGRCPSGATASSGRPRRGRGSSSRTCLRDARSARRARPRGRGAASPRRRRPPRRARRPSPCAPARVEQRCLRGGHQPRTSTMPFFGPGTEPLTSSRFRSGRPRARSGRAASRACRPCGPPS